MKNQYERLAAKINMRRSFAITVSLKEGYEDSAKIHTASEVYQTAIDWMKEKILAHQEYLTGVFTETTLVYAWSGEKGPIGKTEPAIVFSGDVSVYYNPDTTDDDIEKMLNELAGRFAVALGQTRVSLTYKDQSWDIQVNDRKSPRSAETVI